MIVFVCFGNIMRSPMCEALLKKRMREADNARFTVASAGLNATPNREAHPWAIEAAKDFDISLEDHRARLLTSEMVHRADAIFVMDFHNQAQLYARWPVAREKAFLLGAYAGRRRIDEISDPYYSGLPGTRNCYSILNTCIENLTSELLNQKGEEAAV
jgi:protein-tyrosine phosphatase